METSSLNICRFCNQPSVIIWVHGHGQCSICKTNIEECCNGEQAVHNSKEEEKIIKDDNKPEKD